MDIDALDYFRSDALLGDPYSYFDRLRSECPVRREPFHEVVVVTGHEEAVAVFGNPTVFSSCNSQSGPFPGFPAPLEGDDVLTFTIPRERKDLYQAVGTLEPGTRIVVAWVAEGGRLWLREFGRID